MKNLNKVLLVINESKVPVEFILRKEPLINEIVSVYCSTLLFAKKITGRNVKCFSFAKSYNVALDKSYFAMMEKSGVNFI